MELSILISTIITGTVSFLLIFKYYFMKAAKCKSSVRLDGKTVIVTGANTGIGRETAIDLAKRGAHVILACRDLEKAEVAVRHIADVVPGADVITRHLDLASLTSVRKFTDDIHESESRLDILINNAGVGGIPYTQTEDGYEMTFAVNHLGHFLLTVLLLDMLKECAPSRIVNVSAHAHIFYNLDFTDLMTDKDYGSIKAYCRSKLANVLLTRQLAKRLRGTGVTAYALHPGIVHTELTRHFRIMRIPVISTLIDFMGRALLKTAREGCQTTVYCAVSETLSDHSGMYYSNCNLSMPMMTALHEGHAKRLWRESLQLVGLPPDEEEEEEQEEEQEDYSDDDVEIETISDDNDDDDDDDNDDNDVVG